MKHIIILGDGMADLPVKRLGGKTLLQSANKPMMDRLAREGRCGRLMTVPEGFPPGSEVANTAILGYDLNRVYEGRGPLEAASIGYEMADDDLALRCNIITIDKPRLGDGNSGMDGVIVTHNGGNLETEDGDVLIKYLNEKLAGRQITLSIPELKITKKLVTDDNGTAQVQFKAKKLQLWSPDNPKLYDVEITLADETLRDRIGFRTIETKGKQLLLNGKPIFLKGISIHDEKPNGGGRTNSVEDARTLLSWARELGCNYVRLAHYPHNEYMVREAEKMGILVWSEIPVYWTITWTNPDTYANAERQLTDMIRRDQNRANVIIWSVANETPHSPERDKFLSSLAKTARSLDDTRLISMAMEVTSASNYKNRLQDNMNEYVDVISFNQYIGWYRDVNDAPKMEWEIPYDKPVIVSEFGGGARYGLHGDKNERWTEEFQENLYIENLAMLDKIEGLVGTTPWIMKDFRSPRRVLDGIQDYYNRKGLYSDKGEKKKAFYILQSWYSTK